MPSPQEIEHAWNDYLYKNKKQWGIISIGQIESWAKMDDELYHFFEIKHQEPFEPPPFLGHGLPIWQVEKYIQMQFDLGVIWHLVIFDRNTNIGYQQRLSVLEDGRFKDTTKNPRRIYPISSFEVWTDDWTRYTE